MKVLITGCFGFIGFNFLNYVSKKYTNDFNIVGIDSMESNCSYENKKLYLDKENFTFFDLNINDIDKLDSKHSDNIDCVINFAAETHVDNSIFMPEKFIYSNVMGVTELLKFVHKKKIKKLIHVSTDEVYGSTKEAYFKEEDSFNTASPYSASKASAELICNAFSKTYGLNVTMVRPANNYGIYQQPEKLIPFSIAKLINREKIEIYGEGKNIRHWLNVEDTCSAIIAIMNSKIQNEVYNIGSGFYLENIKLAEKLIDIFGLDDSFIEYVEDRPGHDFRYATDLTKLNNIGWKPEANFDVELDKIVDWYKENTQWWLKEYNKILINRKKRLSLD